MAAATCGGAGRARSGTSCRARDTSQSRSTSRPATTGSARIAKTGGPHVFVIACEEGLFPHMRSIEEGSVEEERRLCYVAITRAERELTMTWARRRTVFGNSMSGIPSRFLSEIPREFIAGADDAPVSSSGGGWAAAALTAEVGDVTYRTGQDVVHEQFGRGVVTSIEPGGVVAVRFAGDGAERRLVASLA
ncbi:hypothetical protein EBR56_03770, partial [bacterium]|nr:hypothetical protein [bacterium]